MKLPFSPMISDKALAYFYRQLATMEETGIAPAAALETIRDQFKSPEFQEILQKILDSVQKGGELSNAMSRFPEVFTPLQCSLVRAAETGGNRADTFQMIASSLDRRARVKEELILGLAYPVIVLHFGAIVFAFIAYVFPDGSIGKSFDAILVSLGPVYLIGLGVTLGHRLCGHTEGWDRLLYKVPWYGALRKKFAMIRLTRTLGTLYDAGVNVSEALEQCADVVGSPIVRQSVIEAADLVQGRRPLADAFLPTELFSSTHLQMISVGEKSGRTSETLLKIAEILEDEANHTTKLMLGSLRFVAFITVAAYIGVRIVLHWTSLFEIY